MLRSMARAPQLVLTIHGVSPDRGWQNRAAMALEPHFQCVPITYWQYGSPLGAFAVLFNLSILVILCAALTFLLLHPTWRHAIWVIALTIVGVIASIVVARYRRVRVVDVVKRQISTKAERRRPHVIAHSFGSYICGWALDKFQDLRFGRIVLVGCVLPRSFRWQKILHKRPGAFEEVRNDIGLSDLVVWLLRWFGRIAPDMGTSGLFGFLGGPGVGVVHRSSRAWGPCVTCVQSARRALIHDIFLAKYRHSDWALGPGHARELWLPYLWGLSPREFNEWIECCRDAAFARQEQFWQQLDVAEENLRRRTWTWTQMRTLNVFLEAELESRAQRSKPNVADDLRRHHLEVVRDAFTFTYVAVAAAYEESANPGPAPEATPERNQILLALYPPRAIARALDEAARTRLAIVTSGDESGIAEALATLAVSRRDERAWERLYRYAWPFVRAIVYRRLGGVEGLAEDATQEVFIRLLRYCPFPELQSPDAFRGYLWRVSDNVGRTYRRRIMANHTVALPDDEATGSSDAGAGSAEDIELGQVLQDVWRTLKGPERSMLQMLVEGYSISEIAQTLGLSYGAAAIRLMRLRTKLRKSFVFKGILAADRAQN